MALQAWYPFHRDDRDWAGKTTLRRLVQEPSVAPGLFGDCRDMREGSYEIVGATLGEDYTKAVWIKPTRANGVSNIMSFSGSTQHHVLYQTGTTLYLSNTWTTVAGTYVSVTHTFVVNKWTHIAGTFEGGRMRLYIDGEIVADETGKTNPAAGASVRIGNYGTTNNFQGYMQDARLYNHALTPKEIKEIARGKMLHWSFDTPVGHNMLAEYGADNDWTKWSHWNSAGYWENGTSQYLSAVNGINCMVGKGSTDGSGTYIYDYYPYTFISGKKYTFSVWLRSDVDTGVSFYGYINTNVGGQHNVYSSREELTVRDQIYKEWTQYACVFTCNETTTSGGVGLILGSQPADTNIYWAMPTLVEGEWSPDAIQTIWNLDRYNLAPSDWTNIPTTGSTSISSPTAGTFEWTSAQNDDQTTWQKLPYALQKDSLYEVSMNVRSTTSKADIQIYFSHDTVKDYPNWSFQAKGTWTTWKFWVYTGNAEYSRFRLDNNTSSDTVQFSDMHIEKVTATSSVSDLSGLGHVGVWSYKQGGFADDRPTGKYSLRLDNPVDDPTYGLYEFIRTPRELWIPQQATIMCWLKYPDGWDPFDNVYPFGWNFLSAMGPDMSGERVGLIYYKADGSGYTGPEVSSSNRIPLQDGNWHHVAVSFDNNAKKINVWTDGQFLQTLDIHSSGMRDVEKYVAFTAGSSWSGGTYGPHNGWLDDCRVYASVLSNDDITEIYKEKAYLTKNGYFSVDKIDEFIIGEGRQVRLLSAGLDSTPNTSGIYIDGGASNQSYSGRGLKITAFTPGMELHAVSTFDMYNGTYDSKYRFIGESEVNLGAPGSTTACAVQAMDFMNSIPDGYVFFFHLWDSIQPPSNLEAYMLETFGARQLSSVVSRDAWALIGRKGGTPIFENWIPRSTKAIIDYDNTYSTEKKLDKYGTAKYPWISEVGVTREMARYFPMNNNRDYSVTRGTITHSSSPAGLYSFGPQGLRLDAVGSGQDRAIRSDLANGGVSSYTMTFNVVLDDDGSGSNAQTVYYIPGESTVYIQNGAIWFNQFAGGSYRTTSHPWDAGAGEGRTCAVVCEASGSSTITRIYVGGVMRAEQTWSASHGNLANDYLYFGNGSSTNFLTGYINNFKFFKTALTDQELSQEFNQQANQAKMMVGKEGTLRTHEISEL